VEKPARADKSAPTDVQVILLIGIISPYGCPDYLVNVRVRIKRFDRKTHTRMYQIVVKFTRENQIYKQPCVAKE